jgi:hypothetical protein
LKEGERGNKEEGLGGGKGNRPGGLWLNSHLLPSPPPPTRSRQRGEGRPRGDRPAGVPAGDPGHGDGRETGQNGGGIEGISTLCSPWTGIACGGISAASGGGRLWWLVVVVLGGLGGREVWLGGARQGGEPRRPYYRCGEVGSGEDFLSSRSFDGRQWRWKYPGVDPSGEVLGRDSRRGVNAALWDGTGRPATRWWQAAGRSSGVGWR